MAEDVENNLESTLDAHWFREIHPSSTRGQGWYQKYKFFSAAFMQRSSDQLVISFDNLLDVGKSDLTRAPWGFGFFKKHGYSHLGFQSNQPNWCRDIELIRFFEQLAGSGFFKKFKRVAFSGTSMGGFASLAFSCLVPGSTVIAFSPQTSLNPKIVPWESRFLVGQAQDWSLPYSDGSAGLQLAEKVYIVYDPFFDLDRKQVERISPAENICFLKLFGVGHKTAVALKRIEALTDVQNGAINGTLKEEDFRTIARGRRNIFMYRHGMENYFRAKGQNHRAARLVRLFKANRRRNLQNLGS